MNKVEIAKNLFDRMIKLMREALTEEKIHELDVVLKLEKPLLDKGVKTNFRSLVPEDIQKEVLESVQGMTDTECYEVTRKVLDRNAIPEKLWGKFMWFFGCDSDRWFGFFQAAKRGKISESKSKE